MLVANFVSNPPMMGQTRTYEDFSKFLGEKPHRLGIVSRLYPKYTATFLTEALRNVFYGDNKKAKGFQSIDNTYIEWQVETNQIKRIPFAQAPSGDGANGSEIKMYFSENYYQFEEIFKIEDSGQQCYVTSNPVRLNDHLWEVTVRLIDNDYSEILDETACQPGALTRFIGNAKPEMHDCGFVKYQSNVEKMRNYLTTVRVEDSYSEKYAAMEDSFIKVGKGDNQGNLTETIYRLDPMKKNLIENFLEVRENMMVMAKGTMGVDGKSTLSRKDTGRSVQIGDGLIPQIERFASKYHANKFTIQTFQTVINTMVEKAENDQGNHFVFICNQKGWNIVQEVLGSYLANRKTDGAYLWSKGGEGKYIKVGATFDAYEWGGNVISFKSDRTLTREFKDPYFLCIDLTTGKASSQPPVMMYTLKGGDYMTYDMYGPGLKDGLSSGIVSTSVAGGISGIWGYCSLVVFNPYRSFILTGKE